MSSQAFGDIDDDGNLDLALSGGSESGIITKVYINNGTTLIENNTWQQNVIGIYRGALSFTDIDDDGHLDLILTGHDSEYITRTKIYINNGTTFVENSTWQQNLLGAGWSSLSTGDYNNDKYMDMTLIGHTTTDNHRVYKNNFSTFIEVQKDVHNGGNLAPIFDGSVAFGDYDNDGYLDILATGSEGYTTIYTYNYSLSAFSAYDEDKENLIDLEYGSCAVWYDIDNDGNLDVSITGATASVGRQAKIYISDITTPNQRPSPPSTNFFNAYDVELALSWGNGSDTETPTLGLYYNLRAGTCSGCHDVVSGVYGGSSNPTAGYFGNMMQRKGITLNRHFEAGTKIYWAVQTIDTGLVKSNWSVEQVYTIPESGTPETCEPDWSCSSWGSCQPDSTRACGSWADLNSCNMSYNGSNTGSCTYRRPGSSGGSSYTPPSTEHTFDIITPGIPASVELAGGINVTIKVKNAVSNVILDVSTLAFQPAGITNVASGKVYQYLEMNSSGISDDDIEEAFIEFTVNKSWVDGNKVDRDTVTLHRYHGGEWQALETGFLSEGDDSCGYRATTPGFSYFVITGEEAGGNAAAGNGTRPQLLCTPGSRRCSGSELQECGTMGTVWVAKEACFNGCDPSALACSPTPSGDAPWYYVVIVVMATTVIAVFYFTVKRHRKPRTLEEALKGVQPV